MSEFGPNAKKLLSLFIAREAIPPGGGIASGINFFLDQDLRTTILNEAEKKMLLAIEAVRKAPDNPYGDDQEVIAQALLDKVERVKNERMDRS